MEEEQEKKKNNDYPSQGEGVIQLPLKDQI